MHPNDILLPLLRLSILVLVDGVLCVETEVGGPLPCGLFFTEALPLDEVPGDPSASPYGASSWRVPFHLPYWWHPWSLVECFGGQAPASCLDLLTTSEGRSMSSCTHNLGVDLNQLLRLPLPQYQSPFPTPASPSTSTGRGRSSLLPPPCNGAGGIPLHLLHMWNG